MIGYLYISDVQGYFMTINRNA